MMKRPHRLAGKDEKGLASIVIVGVLIVLLTLISLGFAKIMDRATRNSTNSETATAATYAAQSGLNDLVTYIRDKPRVVANNCKDLIGTETTPGPFYNASNLSGDRNSEYTCILLNQLPPELRYDKLPALKSKVIKLTTDTVPGALDSFMFSWQATDRTKTGLPPNIPTPAFPEEADWNSDAKKYVPMLRLTLYPVPVGGSITNMQDAARTYFLYPQTGSAPGATKVVDFSSAADGSMHPISCDTDGSKDSVPNYGVPTFDCNVVVNNLAVVGTDYYYARLMPIYNNVNIEIKAKDLDNRDVRFRSVQAVLDVTAKVGPAAKRLQARVDIGGNQSDGTLDPSPNVGPDDNLIPEQSIRSSNTLCKRVLVHDDPFDYVTTDSTHPSCDLGTLINTPTPALNYFRINDIDDTDPTPVAPYFGTYYISASPNSALLEWQSTNATSCIGSSNPSDSGWDGEKKDDMTWSGTTGTGDQTRSNISVVTRYTLRCSGPGGTAGDRTVTAWPPPRVSISGPASYRAGEQYTISFSSANSSRCVMSSTGNKPWSQTYTGIGGSGGTSPVDSQPFNTSWDDQSTKTYTVRCTDPSQPDGRPAVANWIVSTSGGNTTINPPSCSGNRDIVDNGNGTGSFYWNMSCPDRSPGSGNYRIESDIPGIGTGNIDASMRNYSGTINFQGTYCLRAIATIPGWSSGGYDSGNKCVTIYAPITIHYFDDRTPGMPGESVVAWDNGPQCNSPGNWYHQLWWCRNTETTVNPNTYPSREPICAHGSYRWTICNVSWSVSGSGPITCTASAPGYGPFETRVHNLPASGIGVSDHSSGPWRWIDGGNPFPIQLRCTNPYGSVATKS